jgi:hypothetical protein
MAAGLHGSARTTPRVRAELQGSQEPTRALAAQSGLNPKTVAKWRQRTTTADLPMGPARPRSTMLSEVEEAIIVAFRRRTLLPLDDVLGCSAPRASQSSRAVPCTAAWNGMASPDCPKIQRRRPSTSALPRPRSATCTLTAANYARPREKSVCSWLSIGFRSSPMSNSIRRPPC